MGKKPHLKELPLKDQAQVAMFSMFLKQAGPCGEAETEAGKRRLRGLSEGLRAWALGEIDYGEGESVREVE